MTSAARSRALPPRRATLTSSWSACSVELANGTMPARRRLQLRLAAGAEAVDRATVWHPEAGTAGRESRRDCLSLNTADPEEIETTAATIKVAGARYPETMMKLIGRQPRQRHATPRHLRLAHPWPPLPNPFRACFCEAPSTSLPTCGHVVGSQPSHCPARPSRLRRARPQSRRAAPASGEASAVILVVDPLARGMEVAASLLAKLRGFMPAGSGEKVNRGRASSRLLRLLQRTSLVIPEHKPAFGSARECGRVLDGASHPLGRSFTAPATIRSMCLAASSA